MKRITLLMIVLFISFGYRSQSNYNSGDKELDNQLIEINTQAKSDLTKFKNDLISTYKIPITKIEELLKEKMEPVEVLLSAQIASISKKPLEQVVSCYKENKTKGWGYIAKQMGIKPGSPEFHALKDQNKAKGNSGNKGNGNGKSKGKSK